MLCVGVGVRWGSGLGMSTIDPFSETSDLHLYTEIQSVATMCDNSNLLVYDLGRTHKADIKL